MKKIKELLTSVLVVSLLVLGVYWAFEPEIGEMSIAPKAMAASTATAEIDVILAVTEGISLSGPGDINMTGITMTISTSSGTGSSWLVKTNAANGYKLTLKADQTDCLDAGTAEFADYSEDSTGTPENWSAHDNAYEFGFTVCGTEVFEGDTRWGTSGVDLNCSCQPFDTDLNWRGFSGTVEITVSTSSSETGTSGSETTLCAGALQGSSVYAPVGNYTADITATATTQ